MMHTKLMNKLKKELPGLREKSKKNMLESIKPSLNNYKKTVKSEQRRPQEKKNF